MLDTETPINQDLCNEPAFNLNRADPSWHNGYGFATIGLLSASMGLQGVMGETLGTGVSVSEPLFFDDADPHIAPNSTQPPSS